MAINWSKGVLKIEAITNVGHSFYDDYVEYTVASRNKMGVKEQIIRRQVARCCKWCSSLVGVYNYGEEPKDVYRRHDNCKCLVTHKSAKGYTDVHSKKVFATQREARINKILELQGGRVYTGASNSPFRVVKKKLSRIGELELVNPKYNLGEEWRLNCQRCVIAYDMRCRGYDVMAKPLEHKHEIDFLSNKPFSAWRNEDGSRLKGTKFESNVKSIYDELSEIMKNDNIGDRYALNYAKLMNDRIVGHIIVVEKTESGIVLLDPQLGIIASKKTLDNALISLAEYAKISDKEVNFDIAKMACINRGGRP